MLQMQAIKKLTWFINTALMGFVIFMTAAYAHYGVTYMVYHSIPTIVAYVVLYWFIHKDKLDIYVWIVYIVITLYMVAATVCIGFNAGFHLYCASLIPLTFYMEYLGYKLHTRTASAMQTSILLVVIYLACTGYAVLKGPLYEVDASFTFRCMIGNAVSVFCFLIGYTSLVHKLVRSSEERLSEMAHKDQLTGLFNRHYVMNYMDELYQHMPPDQWVAMIDIDDFKGINDTYGHHGGDYVLTELARIMREVCVDCVISRWGGEEFLIVTDGTARDSEMLETLRRTVNETSFVFENKTIPVSITIGISRYEEGQSMDRWVQSADRKLYTGKSSGKNQVVY
ncbi:MAG: GGDEF domain-containing protein [Christensenellaceae bacterium]|nr:GGDEF domain-containing protein [Christensenellaceae bacterium]